MRRFLLLLAILFVCVEPLQAQIEVGLEIKRRFLMQYEPIVATVTVKNMAGRDIMLSDTPSQNWFSFQISRGDGQLVPPCDPDYRLTPLTVPAGQSVKRSIVLNTVYPVRELGMYRVRAVIYFSATDKYYQSRMIPLELSEGKTIWQHLVGVPEGANGAGGTRKLSLLSFRQTDYSVLYARVEDVDSGMVYATMPLGHLLGGIDPNVQVDTQGNLHILQAAGPKTYLYSSISLNGELLISENRYSTTTRPTLRRNAAGAVTLVGGSLQPDTGGLAEKAKLANKLSDRPVQIPAE